MTIIVSFIIVIAMICGAAVIYYNIIYLNKKNSFEFQGKEVIDNIISIIIIFIHIKKYEHTAQFNDFL